MKYAIDVPPFEELSDPRLVAELAVAAEERGWDGFFVWDHIVYRAPGRAVRRISRQSSVSIGASIQSTESSKT